MKRIFFFLLQIVVTVFFLFPYIIGYSFLGSMVLAGIGAFIPLCSDLSMTILGYGWKIYLVAAVLTLFVMMTLEFLHCCVGMNTFVGHLRQTGWRDHLDVFGVAVLWPIMWGDVHRLMSSLGMPWFAIIIDVVHYWTVLSWRGTPMGLPVEICIVKIEFPKQEEER